MKLLANVNNGRSDSLLDIDVVEKKYSAKYVGQLCLKTKSGWQEDSCAEVFYQETPPMKGYSNYFGIIRQMGGLYITSGASAVEGNICGVIADDGEIIYSRYTHDYRKSKDGTAWVDGGRSYTRRGNNPVVMMQIIKGEFYEV